MHLITLSNSASFPHKLVPNQQRGILAVFEAIPVGGESLRELITHLDNIKSW